MTTSRTKAAVAAPPPAQTPVTPPARPSLAPLPSAAPVRLSDAALLLLGQAAERPDGMLLPPPAALRARGGALRKVLQTLLKAVLVSEVPVVEVAQGWRQDEDGRHVGLAITAEGFRAIGLPAPEAKLEAAPAQPAPASKPKSASRPRPAKAAAPQAEAPAPMRTEPQAETAPGAPEPKRHTKQAKLVSLLSAEGGQSVTSLATALAWQNHTVRAALTGLRQKGHDLVKLRDAGGATVYRITEAGRPTPTMAGQGA